MFGWLDEWEGKGREEKRREERKGGGMEKWKNGGVEEWMDEWMYMYISLCIIYISMIIGYNYILYIKHRIPGCICVIRCKT